MRTNEQSLCGQASVSLARNKDILVATALRDPLSVRAPNARASTSSQIEDVNSDDKEPAKVRSGKKKHSASEIIDILKEADEEAKDSIIQEFFMKEDF